MHTQTMNMFAATSEDLPLFSGAGRTEAAETPERKHVAVETKLVPPTIKKRARPSYSGRDLNETLEAASSMALMFDLPFQVCATAYGYRIIGRNESVPATQSYFETNGKVVTLYKYE